MLSHIWNKYKRAVVFVPCLEAKWGEENVMVFTVIVRRWTSEHGYDLLSEVEFNRKNNNKRSAKEGFMRVVSPHAADPDVSVELIARQNKEENSGTVVAIKRRGARHVELSPLFFVRER